MPLSPEDKKRIEQEEYRRAVRLKMEKQVSVDVNSRAEVETHGVGREMYRDWKRGVQGCAGIIIFFIFAIVAVALFYGKFAQDALTTTP
jgi:hypothetical protein